MTTTLETQKEVINKGKEKECYFLLQAYYDGKPSNETHCRFTKERVTEYDAKVAFTPEGWVFENEEEAKKIADKLTDGKRKVIVVDYFKYYLSVIEKIFNGNSKEIKLNSKILRSIYESIKTNKEIDGIKRDCNKTILDALWLTIEEENLNGRLNEKEQEAYDFYKPLYEKALEKCDEFSSRKRQ